jgi:succinyl-CoA synthetase alpha subunit
MTVVKTHLIRQEYRDSVQLMRAASAADKLDGVHIASVLMGTEKNKPLLEEVDLLTPEAKKAGPNDIVISIRADTETIADEAIHFITDFLSQTVQTAHDSTLLYRSIRGALSGLPTANLAVISVPGDYAARDTHIALLNNLNVLLFSDNVPLEDEQRLKQEAHKKGLLLMGPDCGTAMIKNVGLGFANVVSPGPVGIVAASGTGTQEVMTLCHHQQLGVTHAIGTGSRDVKDSIGGITMIDGLLALERDPMVELIILVSKPPEEKTMEKVLSEISNCTKPVIINFLGKQAGYFETPQKTITVNTLEEAAYSAVSYFNTGQLTRTFVTFDDEKRVQDILIKTKTQLTANQKYIRGLFAGGTFTFEAAQVIQDLLPNSDNLYTNVHLEGTKPLENAKESTEHTLVDMGDDEFTLGKPHPMIDQSERTKRFLDEIQNPKTAVVLIDFVLGYGSHLDPVFDMDEAFQFWKSNKHPIPIVAHVCGTPLDPQDYQKSIDKLNEYGIFVMPTNAQAARLAALIATKSDNIKL